MPTDRAVIEMTQVGSTDRPLNHLSSSNTSGHQGDGVSLGNSERGGRGRAYLFFYRFGQVVFVSIYLAVLIHAVLHKGWWIYVDVPLAFGRKSTTP